MDEYTVEINGIEHTVLLDEEHAKALGAKKAEAPNKAKAPANKRKG